MNKITAPELYERENNSKTWCKGAAVGLFSEPIYRLKFLQKSDITYRLIWSFLIRKISTVSMKTNSRSFIHDLFNVTSSWKKSEKKRNIKLLGSKKKLIRWKISNLMLKWFVQQEHQRTPSDGLLRTLRANLLVQRTEKDFYLSLFRCFVAFPSLRLQGIRFCS